jgi:hypothetical protein
LYAPLSIFSFQNRRLEAGVPLTPSIYRGEPAIFVRNGEMARGVQNDKFLRDKVIKNFIFFGFWFLTPARFVSNGEKFKRKRR